MTDFRIRVIVDPSRAVRGTRQVEGQLNRVGAAATRVQRLITGAFAFGGLALGLTALTRAADSVTNLENRLRLLGGTSQDVERRLQNLFAISNRTRSSFEATGAIYSRVGLAARELGLETGQLERFTESLNQAVILSGASAREAEFALIQLSQGLASGTLRGDELRSVLEQLPFVADVIAEELGVTRGALRELGAEGQITADIVLRAFENAGPRIAEQFANTAPTISQAFQVVRNEATRLVAALDDAFGNASGLFAELLLAVAGFLGTLADNADVLVRILEVLAVVITARVVVALGQMAIAATRSIASMIALEVALGATSRTAALMSIALKTAQRAMIALNLAFLANPIGLVIAAIGALIGLLYVFSDEIAVTADGVVSLGDVFRAVFSFIMEFLGPVVDFFKDVWQNGLDAVRDRFGSWGDAIATAISAVVEFGKTAVNTYIGVWVGAVRTIIAAWDLFPDALRGIGVAAVNGLIEVVDSGITKLVQGIGNVLEFLGRAFEAVGLDNPFAGLFDDFSTGLEEFRLEGGRSVSDVFSEIGGIAAREFGEALNTDFLGNGVNAILARAREIAEARAAEGGRADLNPDTPTPPGIPGTPGAGTGGAGGESVEQLLRKSELIAEVIQGLEQEEALLRLNNDQREVESRILDIQAQAKENNIQLSEAELDALRERIRLTQDLEQSLQFVGDVGEAVFGGIDDAVADFIRTGEFNFKQFATNVVAELARIATQALLIRPLIEGLTSFIGGNGFTFNQPSLASAFNIGGNQFGGSVTMGGSGGPDSQLFVSKVSPGERIDFTPEGEGSGRRRGGDTFNFNISTPDVDGFRRSQSQVAAVAARAIGSGKRNM